MSASYTDLGEASVAQTEPEIRATFIRRTYAHLAGAVGAFVLIEMYFFQSGIARKIAEPILTGRIPWLAVLGIFMVSGWLARSLAYRAKSQAAQYAGLLGYVVAQAIIFVPMLYMAAIYADDGSIILNAGIVTGFLFLGLTTVAFTTRVDFSFLRSILTIGGFLAIGLIVSAVIFGFGLGLWFSVGMVVLASGAILYDTHKIQSTFSPDQHVAASLELFASVALLFWYVLSIMMRRR
jgi:FtsH-binding integral membrane protein